MPIFVNMNDSFMSGWGLAANGRSIYCIECQTEEEAAKAYAAAKERPEMRYVDTSNKPRRGRRGDHVKVVRYGDVGWVQ